MIRPARLSFTLRPRAGGEKSGAFLRRRRGPLARQGFSLLAKLLNMSTVSQGGD